MATFEKGRQGNFVINDIDLYIPPQHISVRKEDLEWKWKTLRSKASTKIPSGHGMAQVSVKMTFTPELILDLHRLIVQFRHSPFCYVDSLYLRNAMVPHWPAFQQMAFTMSSLHVEPMPKAPNTYTVQLDLRWFNYFPYSINYLFRDDWVTQPIELAGDNGEFYDGTPTVGRFTIPTFGVGLAPLQSLIPEIVASDRRPVQEYKVMAQEPEKNNAPLNLHHLEATHRGVVFDLLPLPSRMAPARFETRPSDSNIYVRYINTLQQKALYENFGIDVYSDITDGGNYPERFEPWGIGKLEDISEEHVGTRRKVYGLHNTFAGNHSRGWVKQMHDKSRSLNFSYHSYKNVELSQGIQLKQQKQQERAIKEALSTYRALGPKRPGGEASPRPISGFIWPIAQEDLIEDELNHVGEKQEAPGLYRGFGARASAIREGLTDETAEANGHKLHRGLDIRCAIGTPVRAVADGFVIKTAGSSIWENPNKPQQGLGVRLYIEHQDDEGNYKIVSGYAHLDGAEGLPFKAGDEVKQGQIIGKTGDSGNISNRKKEDAHAAEGYTGALGSTPVHLHFTIRASISNERGYVRGNKFDPLSYYTGGYGTGPAADRPEPVVILDADAEPKPSVTTPTDRKQWVEEQRSVLSPEAYAAATEVDRAHEEENAARDEFGLTKEEKISLEDTIGQLYNGGWRYYENDADILGVWRRLNIQTVYSSNNDADYRSPLTPDGMSLVYKEGMVLTGVSGGLSHVIASIPILGSEFPTHQHLGSIEPIFQFEFVSLADDNELAGLSDAAQWLEGMRSELQYNSRRFRPVPDCWTCSTDHFITRLLGTYSEADAKPLENGELLVKKRTTISSSETRTIEGNPGLSGILVEITETNPYNEDPIKPINNIPDDLGVRRKEILKALDSLSFSDEGETAALLQLGKTMSAEDVDVYSQNPKYNGLPESIGRRNTEVLKFTHISDQHTGRQATKHLEHNMGDSVATQTFIQDLLTRAETSNVASKDDLGGQTFGQAGKVFSAFSSSGNRSAGNGVDVSLDSIASRLAQDPDLEIYEEEIDLSQEAIGQSRGMLGKDTADRTTTTQVVDATRFYEYNPELARVNWGELAHYYNALNKLQQLARLIMSESDFDGALDEGTISEQLYELPDTEPSMWRSFFFYYSASLFTGLAGIDGYDSFSDTQLTGEMQKVLNLWNIPIQIDTLKSDKGKLRSIYPSFSAPFSAGVVDAGTLFAGPVYNFVGSIFEGAPERWTAYLENKGLAVEQNIVDRYMSLFNVEIGLPEFIFNEIPFLSGIAFTGKGKEALRLRRSYEEVAFEVRAGISYFDEKPTPDGPDSPHGTKWLRKGPFDVYKKRRAPQIAEAEAEAAEAAAEMQAREDSLQDGYHLDLAAASRHADDRAGAPGAGKASNLVITIPVNKQTEENKLSHLNAALTSLANKLLGNPGILAVFGLKELLSAGIETDDWTGAGCYPDLDLPAHPYYPTELHQTSPDFYMWSIYEDGPGALQGALAAQVSERIEPAILGAYNHLKAMQKDGGLKSSDIEELTILDEGRERSALLHNLTHHPEGCDEVQFMNKDGSFSPDAGPTQEAFYAGADGNYKEWLKSGDNAIVQMEKRIEELTESQRRAAAGGSSGARGAHGGTTGRQVEAQRAVSATKEALKKRVKELKLIQNDIKPLAPMLSIGDGNPLYSNVPRADEEKYVELINAINGTESFFGSRQGHLGDAISQETADMVASNIRGTQLQSQLDAHRMAFDPAALKQLAIDSSKDIVSEKLTMRRAFPTFKLMFVEEDENESRFLNFDDFYSYNGVKEFNVSLDRNHPADTAVIVLQNVAGTLDGTKRNVITDLDYFDRKKTDEIEKDNPSARTTGGSSTQLTPANDQPFGAVVLRPGLNVQLRAGYSDDPNALEVLISGRVVDVVWTQAGDLAEIVVQSFGTELVQVLKGRREFEYEGAEPEVYQSTHKLLGSLMLEPELKHFGRWEFGQLFQPGEAKDSRLDFTDYTRGTWNGTFGLSQKLGRWISHNPIATLAIGTGLSVFAARFGGGALLGRASKFILGGGGRAGVGAARSAAFKAPLTNSGVANALKTALAETSNTGKLAGFLFRNNLTTRAGLRALSAAERGFVHTATRAITSPGSSAVEIARATEILTAAFANVNRQVAAKALIGYKATAPLGAGFWQSGGFRMAWQASGTQFGRMVRGGAAIFATGATVNIAGALLAPIKNKVIQDTKEWYTRNKVSLMLSPQDDNLYPPSPKDYMDYQRLGVGQIVGRFALHGISSTVFGKGNAVSRTRAWYKKFTNPEKWFLDKRVTPDECQYTPINTTIWEMFHEMSLRHPGWIYSARPYGHKFRYTMFFGVPSQRYWSKPASNGFIDRITSLRDFLDSGEIDERKFITLYGQTAFDDLFWEIFPEHKLEFLAHQVHVEDLEKKDQLTITQRMTNKTLREYLKGLELRFVPFRRYHLITSDTDIVHNGLIASEHNVANAVSVQYREGDTDSKDLPTKSVTMKASSLMPDSMIRMVPVYYPNLKGYQMALRYGQASLIYGLKQMYRGEILILGNPRIRPWDICFLMDNYHDMIGPVEVERVTHMMSHEHGFLTEIKPNALVVGNEISTWPVIEAMKLYIMAVMDFQDGKTGLGFSEENFQDKVLKIMDNMEKPSPRYKKHIEEKLKEIVPDNYVQDIMNSFPEDVLAKKPSETMVVGGLATAGAIGTAFLGYGAFRTVGGFGGKVLKYGWSKGTGDGFWRGLLGGASRFSSHKGTAAAGAIGASAALDSANWIRDSFDNPGLAWFIAAPILFAQVSKEESVSVIPLQKNGIPIVAGLSYKDPMMQWKNIQGNVVNAVDDTIGGTRDLITEWRQGGMSLWRGFGNPNKDKMTGY